MNEQLLRTQVCENARQLWQRGLIVADGGLLTVECHRQRFLVTPPGRRRSNLDAHEIQLVDLRGQYVSGEGGLSPKIWGPHRLAYGGQREQPDVVGSLHGVRATALVDPPNTAALSRLNSTAIKLGDMSQIMVVDASDERAVTNALRELPAVIIPPLGVFCTGPDLASVLNLIERIEHAATIELACLGKP